jgi:hypothetical protein
MKLIHVPWALTDLLVRPKHRKRDMRFGTWNVRRLHRSVLLLTVATELVRYKLDLAGEQEVRCDRGSL